ncbi:MAG: phosphoribosyltransferase family protein [Pseudomonadota bacterium]
MQNVTPLYTETVISARIDAIADEIARDHPGSFILAPVLTGAFVFAADLMRALWSRGCDPEVDFVQLSSYGGARSSSGVVKLLKDFSIDITGKSVVIVDDVLDTGRSLHFAQAMAVERGATSSKICVLVRKNTGRSVDVDADYVGFEAGPDEFLVGYGMDDDGLHRGLPYIGTV